VKNLKINLFLLGFIVFATGAAYALATCPAEAVEQQKITFNCHQPFVHNMRDRLAVITKKTVNAFLRGAARLKCYISKDAKIESIKRLWLKNNRCSEEFIVNKYQSVIQGMTGHSREHCEEVLKKLTGTSYDMFIAYDFLTQSYIISVRSQVNSFAAAIVDFVTYEIQQAQEKDSTTRGAIEAAGKIKIDFARAIQALFEKALDAGDVSEEDLDKVFAIVPPSVLLNPGPKSFDWPVSTTILCGNNNSWKDLLERDLTIFNMTGDISKIEKVTALSSALEHVFGFIQQQWHAQ